MKKREKLLEELLKKALLYVELNADRARNDEGFGYHDEENEEETYPSVWLEKRIKETLGLPGDFSCFGRST